MYSALKLIWVFLEAILCFARAKNEGLSMIFNQHGLLMRYDDLIDVKFAELTISS